MYQHHISGQETFKNKIEGYGQAIKTYFSTEDGETPMSLLNAALGSCMLMCVQGYLKKTYRTNIPVTMDIQYEDMVFHAKIQIDQDIQVEQVPDIVAYIDKQCRVKKHFGDHVRVGLVINGFEAN